MVRVSRPLAGTALVTGASRGIGRVVALQLAGQGHPVAINYRAAQADAEEVVRAIRERGGRAVAIRADVAVPFEAATLVERAERALGTIDILINNAGVTRDRLVLQMSEEDWEATWQVNLSGARTVMRGAVASMISRGRGRIVNIGSVVSVTGNHGQANYAAAKSALVGMTREYARRVAPLGIAINCVLPGLISTDATAHLNEAQRAGWIDRIPMARPAISEEVADLVVFLVTGNASYITGQCIAVDGGYLAAAGLGS